MDAGKLVITAVTPVTSSSITSVTAFTADKIAAVTACCITVAYFNNPSRRFQCKLNFSRSISLFVIRHRTQNVYNHRFRNVLTEVS